MQAQRGLFMTLFQEMLQRIQAGDGAAAEEFVQVYEPYVRQVVRARLRVARLRRLADSGDFCQAVLASFLIRATVGEYDVAGPVELKRLLGRMAVNKVVDLARKPEFRKTVVAVSAPGVPGVEPVEPGAGPATQLAWAEMLQAVRSRLSGNERLVSELRSQGLSWNEVADRLGEKPDAVRNRLNRAMMRIARELGFEGFDDD
jgi:DNA-directed RNA polymerase specialized sigma24 family protein